MIFAVNGKMKTAKEPQSLRDGSYNTIVTITSLSCEAEKYE